MQIKTILKYVTPVRMTIFDNRNNTNADIGGRELIYKLLAGM